MLMTFLQDRNAYFYYVYTCMQVLCRLQEVQRHLIWWSSHRSLMWCPTPLLMSARRVRLVVWKLSVSRHPSTCRLSPQLCVRGRSGLKQWRSSFSTLSNRYI